MGLFSIEGQYVSFNVTNTKTVTEAFNKANKDQLIPLFEDLKIKQFHLQKMKFVTIIFKRCSMAICI